jgi:hypothetical protein
VPARLRINSSANGFGHELFYKDIDLLSGFEKTWKIIDFVIEKDGFSTVKHILVKSHNSCFTHPLKPFCPLPGEKAQVRFNLPSFCLCLGKTHKYVSMYSVSVVEY